MCISKRRNSRNYCIDFNKVLLDHEDQLVLIADCMDRGSPLSVNALLSIIRRGIAQRSDMPPLTAI